jgi:glycine/D-amino acid oxidase-like deaminating enzyme
VPGLGDLLCRFAFETSGDPVEDLVRVLIVGGGVIGSAAAYFLARSGADVTVIERAGVACAASGKSGGFLALDWCDGSPLEPLARRSFALHATLPGEIGGDWGYRRMEAYGGTYRRAERARDRPVQCTRLAWVADGVGIGGQIGSTETTAQVDPGRFTQALMQAAIRNGASLRIARVEEVLRDDRGRVRGVRADGEDIAADAVVIAMGPWSMMAAAWLPLPQVFGLKGHSLIYEHRSRPCRRRRSFWNTPMRAEARRRRSSRGPTARRISAASRARARFPAIPPPSPPIRARWSDCRRSRRTSRRFSPGARSSRGRPASGR